MPEPLLLGQSHVTLTGLDSAQLELRVQAWKEILTVELETLQAQKLPETEHHDCGGPHRLITVRPSWYERNVSRCPPDALRLEFQVEFRQDPPHFLAYCTARWFTDSRSALHRLRPAPSPARERPGPLHPRRRHPRKHG